MIGIIRLNTVHGINRFSIIKKGTENLQHVERIACLIVQILEKGIL